MMDTLRDEPSPRRPPAPQPDRNTVEVEQAVRDARRIMRDHPTFFDLLR